MRRGPDGNEEIRGAPRLGLCRNTGTILVHLHPSDNLSDPRWEDGCFMCSFGHRKWLMICAMPMEIS